MKGLTSLLYQTSKLDAQEGIEYRMHPIKEVVELAPSKHEGGAPCPEAVLWLLLTGEYPTKKQMDSFSSELNERGKLPSDVEKMILGLPKDMHPMTQFSIGILANQTDSIFAKQYRDGLHKSKYWEYVFEDAINVIAKNKRIAGLIYHNLYR